MLCICMVHKMSCLTRLNVGPTRRRMKKIAAMVKAAPDLEDKGKGPLARVMKIARVAIARV